MHKPVDPSETRDNLLKRIRASLWFLRQSHQRAHWSCTGPEAYAKHLLFQRLYEAVDPELDSIGEKIMGLDDNESGIHHDEDAPPYDELEAVHRMFVIHAVISDPVERALQAEASFLQLLEDAYRVMDRRGTLTLGLSDLIPAIASQHETHMYLLRQSR